VVAKQEWLATDRRANAVVAAYAAELAQKKGDTMKVRAWTVGEMFGHEPDKVVKQSDQLTEAIGKIIFGKHPGAQMLSLAECAAMWVLNHSENHEEHLALFCACVTDFVRTKPKP
jgi:hypothetical protein